MKDIATDPSAPKPTTLKGKLEDALQSLIMGASWHVIPTIVSATKFSTRSVWTVFLFLALGCMFTQFYSVANSYFKYAIQISATVTKKDAIVFPAVTLCNMNPFKREFVPHLQNAAAESLGELGSISGCDPQQVDCEYTTEHGTCSTSCGPGVRVITNRITIAAENGGKPCPRETMTESCSIGSCSGECQYSTERGPCSTVCGTGVRTITKTVSTSSGDESEACPPLITTESCINSPCERLPGCYTNPATGKKHCYFLANEGEAMNFTAANQACSTERTGAFLATLDSQDKIKHLRDNQEEVFSSSKEPYWIGLHIQEEADSANYIWSQTSQTETSTDNFFEGLAWFGLLADRYFIPDANLNASSILDEDHSYIYSRPINAECDPKWWTFRADDGDWTDSNSERPYIMARFDEDFVILAVTIQGIPPKCGTSEDFSDLDIRFALYKETGKIDKIFSLPNMPKEVDEDLNAVTYLLDRIYSARAVQLRPKFDNPAIRWEVFGIKSEEPFQKHVINRKKKTINLEDSWTVAIVSLQIAQRSQLIAIMQLDITSTTAYNIVWTESLLRIFRCEDASLSYKDLTSCGDPVATKVGEFLTDTTYYRGFWIHWGDDSIRVGRGYTPFMQEALRHEFDPINSPSLGKPTAVILCKMPGGNVTNWYFKFGVLNNIYDDIGVTGLPFKNHEWQAQPAAEMHPVLCEKVVDAPARLQADTQGVDNQPNNSRDQEMKFNQQHAETSTTSVEQPHSTTGSAENRPSDDDNRPSDTGELVDKLPSNDVSEEEQLLEVFNDLPDTDKKRYGYQANEFILDCIFGGRPCYPEDFYRWNHPLFGNCYTFNSGWDSIPVSQSTRPGVRWGFQATINVGSQEYVYGVDNTSGIIIVVHDQNKMAFPEETGLLAYPGSLQSTAISKLVFERLGKPYRDCVGRKDKSRDMFTSFYPTNYSQEGCSQGCYQSVVISKCGCRDPSYPTTTNATACKKSNGIQEKCRSGIEEEYADGSLGCKKYCPPPCSEVQFKFKSSATIWPNQNRLEAQSEKYKDRVPYLGNKHSLLNNLIRVEIFYRSFSVETKVQVPEYGPAKAFSDVGDVLAMWLGVEIITALELLEMLIVVMVISIGHYFQLRRQAREAVEKIALQAQKHLEESSKQVEELPEEVEELLPREAEAPQEVARAASGKTKDPRDFTSLSLTQDSYKSIDAQKKSSRAGSHVDLLEETDEGKAEAHPPKLSGDETKVDTGGKSQAGPGASRMMSVIRTAGFQKLVQTTLEHRASTNDEVKDEKKQVQAEVLSKWTKLAQRPSLARKNTQFKGDDRRETHYQLQTTAEPSNLQGQGHMDTLHQGHGHRDTAQKGRRETLHQDHKDTLHQGQGRKETHHQIGGLSNLQSQARRDTMIAGKNESNQPAPRKSRLMTLVESNDFKTLLGGNRKQTLVESAGTSAGRKQTSFELPKTAANSKPNKIEGEEGTKNAPQQSKFQAFIKGSNFQKLVAERQGKKDTKEAELPVSYARKTTMAELPKDYSMNRRQTNVELPRTGADGKVSKNEGEAAVKNALMQRQSKFQAFIKGSNFQKLVAERQSRKEANQFPEADLADRRKSRFDPLGKDIQAFADRRKESKASDRQGQTDLEAKARTNSLSPNAGRAEDRQRSSSADVSQTRKSSGSGHVKSSFQEKRQQ